MSFGPTISKDMQIRAAIMQEMSQRFQPHRGQETILYALNVKGCKFIFIQCGRKWGKTEIELRIAVENCVLPVNEGLTTLYVAYEDDQAKKIVWNESRAQKFAHPSWIKDVWESEMIIEFKNGRLLQIDGSNNYKKHEGIRPSMLLCDEFKRFKAEFWDAMEPNLSVYNAPVIFAGSPPEAPCQYVDMAEFVKRIEKETGEGFFTQQPSWMNDKTPGLIEWLSNRKKFYIDRGQVRVWDREYGAIYSEGGSRRLLPEFRKDRVQRSEEFLKAHVVKTASEWDWICSADPATGDPFAVVFMAIHRTTKRVAIVDVIYEEDRAAKTVQAMWAQIQSRIRRWYPRIDEWYFTFDDQNAWWSLEFNSQIPEGRDKPNWMPAGKQTRGKDVGLGILNQIINRDLLWVNEHCQKLFWEYENYQTDENGKVTKGKDHTIDASRYALYANHYDSNEVPDEVIPDEYLRDPWLMERIREQEGIDDNDLMEDWTNDMFSDWGRL